MDCQAELTYVRRRFTHQHVVIHPSNRARRRATSLIKTNKVSKINAMYKLINNVEVVAIFAFLNDCFARLYLTTIQRYVDSRQGVRGAIPQQKILG